MSEWENSIGQSDEWYTPPEIFKALGLVFDIDVASPGRNHWVPAKNVYTKFHDGLTQPWGGVVFMNPPFGKRNGQVPWLRKFIAHGNGIAIVPARTSAGWFHDLIPMVHAILFPKGKTKFHKPDGGRGKSPGSGIVILAMGDECCTALEKSRLGIFINMVQANSK